jgi:hypothetical protein
MKHPESAGPPSEYSPYMYARASRFPARTAYSWAMPGRSPSWRQIWWCCGVLCAKQFVHGGQAAVAVAVSDAALQLLTALERNARPPSCKVHTPFGPIRTSAETRIEGQAPIGIAQQVDLLSRAPGPNFESPQKKEHPRGGSSSMLRRSRQHRENRVCTDRSEKAKEKEKERRPFQRIRMQSAVCYAGTKSSHTQQQPAWIVVACASSAC